MNVKFNLFVLFFQCQVWHIGTMFKLKGADGNMYDVYLFIAILEWKGIDVPVGHPLIN